MTKITQSFDTYVSHFSKKWRIAHYIPRLTSVLGLSFFAFLFTTLIPNNSLSAAPRYCDVAACSLNTPDPTGSIWNTIGCGSGIGGTSVAGGDDVTICGGSSVTSSTAGGAGLISVNSLTIESGAQFGVSKNDTVRIATTLTSNSGNYSICRAIGPGAGVCGPGDTATLLVMGNVFNNATTTVNMKFNGIFQMHGNLTNSNAVTWNNDPAPALPRINFNATLPAPYTITSGGAILPAVNFSGVGNYTLQDSLSIVREPAGDALTISNGTLNTGTNHAVTVNRTLLINGGNLIANGSNITLRGNARFMSGSFDSGTSTVVMTGNQDGTPEEFFLMGFTPNSNGFYNLTIDSNAGTSDTIKPRSDTLIVKGSFSVSSGDFSTDDIASPGIHRDLQITANYSHTGGTSSFNTANVSIGGNYSRTAGTVNLQDSTVTVSGGWVGGFNPGNSSVVFNSTSTGNNINASGVFFNNLEFNGAGGGWNLLNWLGATGSFQLNNGTVNQANNFIYARGNVSQTSGTITATTGLMYFDGTANQRVLTNFSAPRVSLQTTVARRITFNPGSTFTVTNQFTAKGASGPNRLQLCTDNGAGNCGPGTWNLNIQGTKTSAPGDFDWLDIANSDASSSIAGAKPILASFGNNLNNGVNVDWFPNIIYVRTPGDGGSDANPGSPALPKATIRHAIETICPAPPCSGKEVRVAGGLYTVTFGTNQIQIREGVSLYGGYDPTNWATRNAQTFPTRVRDSIAIDGSIGVPNRPIEATSGAITSATIIDGFYFEATPTNNWGVGFFVSNGAPIIRNNIIFGGQAGPRHGLHITGGSPAVYNNMLHGGTGSQTRGLYLSGGFPTIRSNTIFAGTGANRFPVMLDGGSAGSDIQNNAIFCNAGGQGIRENTATATPAVVRNNAMLDCPAAYFDSSTVPPAAGSIAGVAAMEADIVAEGQTASGNIQMASPFTDPDGPDNDYATLLDNDFTFSNPQTANLLQGGIDGNAAGWGFNTDLTGTVRTNTTPQSPNNANAQGWTIGAYENDGAATIPPTPVYYTRLSGLWSTATNWS
ncbi:MAG: hypothetical protein KDK41_17895, partial [Leptospiraceae bacterium]|nr:hypothetical protein [Leptospiraceae bacterium]